MALNNRNLIDEDVEAWKHGPIFPHLYREFVGFAGNPITAPARFYSILVGDFVISPVPTDVNDIKFIDNVWEAYGSENDLELSAMSHVVGSPWDIAKKNGHKYINNNDIRRYFLNLI